MEPGAKGSFAVQDLTFLARSIRRAAVYYERAMLEAPNKPRLVAGLSGCIEGSVRNAVEVLSLSSQSIQQQSQACAASVAALESKAKETSSGLKAQMDQLCQEELSNQMTPYPSATERPT